MSVLNQPTLVLNKNWAPIHVTTVREAVSKACCDGADILDPADYMRYSWMEWMELTVGEGERFIQSVHSRIRVPEVVVLAHYDRVPIRELKLTRKNLMIRDRFRCQYSGRRLRPSEATIDHVVPESRNGKTVWENVVLCDSDVNRRKANRTPEEAGLTLMKKPTRPAWGPLFTASVADVPQSWKPFLPKNSG
jgi:5-methylcytosine-specific restriction endonuclease McrA